jgi:hypothetical protein
MWCGEPSLITFPHPTDNTRVRRDGLKPDTAPSVQPRHSVVERTNCWINYCWRMDRQNKTTLAAHEGVVHLSYVTLLLRRLDQSSMLDTP